MSTLKPELKRWSFKGLFTSPYFISAYMHQYVTNDTICVKSGDRLRHHTFTKHTQQHGIHTSSCVVHYMFVDVKVCTIHDGCCTRLQSMYGYDGWSTRHVARNDLCEVQWNL